MYLRRLLGKLLNATETGSLRDRVARLTDEVLTKALEVGHFEVMEDLARRIPVTVACDIIGIPEADRERVRSWAVDLTQVFTFVLPESDRPAVNEAATNLRAYVRGLLDNNARPQQLDQLLRAARGQGADIAVSVDDLVDNIIFLLLGGFATTVQLIATGCSALLTHPAEFARLRANASLVPSAVEEFLRYDAPIQHVGRIVVAPLQIEDQTIRTGRIVHLLLGSANHDDRQFADPSKLDIARHPNPHVSFGGGPHACLGWAVARLEAEVIFSRIRHWCAVFEPAGDVVRKPTQVFRTYTAIPVRVERASNRPHSLAVSPQRAAGNPS